MTDLERFWRACGGAARYLHSLPPDANHLVACQAVLATLVEGCGASLGEDWAAVQALILALDQAHRLAALAPAPATVGDAGVN